MTTTYSQTVLSPWLTPVRLCSTSNVSGTYYNGPNNNGIGATLTVAASSLTIDSVACAVGDRVLLQTQTNTYEQGIYVVTSIGSTVVLTRADDMQSIEQMKAGQYVSVGAGSSLAGNFYSLVEPLPQVIGSDDVVFNADPSAGGVSFSGGASTANALVVFSNTSGDIKAASAASTFGQDLAITGALSCTTSFDCSAGDITAGSDSNAGIFESYPATTASGTLRLAAVDSSADVAVTISNADHGQASVYSIPDVGAATGQFLVKTAALVDGQLIKASGTAGVVEDAGFSVIANTTAAYGGGGTSNAFTATGLTTSSIVTASILTSTNAVSIAKVVPTANTLTITFSSDPGASTTVSYIAITPAV